MRSKGSTLSSPEAPGDRSRDRLKLAHQGVKIAVHYYKNEEAAQDTLTKVREQGSDAYHAADVTRLTISAACSTASE